MEWFTSTIKYVRTRVKHVLRCHINIPSHKWHDLLLGERALLITFLSAKVIGDLIMWMPKINVANTI